LVGWRITTAVAWSWTPIARLTLRPRRLLVALTVATAIAVPWLGPLPLLALGVAAAIDTVAGRRLARHSVRDSTAGHRETVAPATPRRSVELVDLPS
jgi:hypothetical protein